MDKNEGMTFPVDPGHPGGGGEETASYENDACLLKNQTERQERTASNYACI